MTQCFHPSQLLDSDQSKKLAEFLAERYAAMVIEQKKFPEIAKYIVVDADGKERPYLGAIGGGLTYEFTPTSLGTVTRVTFASGTQYEKTVDLTDYDSW